MIPAQSAADAYKAWRAIYKASERWGPQQLGRAMREYRRAGWPDGCYGFNERVIAEWHEQWIPGYQASAALLEPDEDQQSRRPRRSEKNSTASIASGAEKSEPASGAQTPAEHPPSPSRQRSTPRRSAKSTSKVTVTQGALW
jgi:hypothetical protein